MSKLTELRQRIRAVENIQRITRTMATVAAARLSRARRRAAGMRECGAAYREIVANQRGAIATHTSGGDAELISERAPIRSVAILVITAERGLCGGYNLDVSRAAVDLAQRASREGRAVRYAVVGRRGALLLARRRADIALRLGWGRAGPDGADVERILGAVEQLYRAGTVDEVQVVYSEFHSAIERRPCAVRLLPIRLDESATTPPTSSIAAWIHEPSAELALADLVRVHLRVQLHAALLEAYASEQGARMVTMEEATERADRALHDLRVRHNRLRREAITTELLATRLTARTGGSREDALAAWTHHA